MRRTILLIMTILGIAFLIPAAVMLGIFHQTTQGMIPMEGTIADWSGDHPVIAYTLDGQAYVSMMSVSYSPHWPIGSPYRVMVDPEHPVRATDYFLVLMAGIFGVLAIVQLGVGFTVWRVMGRGARRREEILQYGLRTTALVTELRENRSVQVNNRHPWVAIATCTHPTTREQVTIKSHMLWSPTVAEGDRVDVAFDPMDERRYAMDIREEKR